jgi:hypothetical protein
MFTHTSSTQCNHQHCPHTFPIHVVNDHLHLCIHPHSDDVKSSDSTVDMVFRFKLFTPKMFFHMRKQPVIRKDKILSVGRMCQHIPAPLLHQTVHIMMAMRSYIVLEQNAQAVLVVMVKSWSHLILHVYNNTGH